MIATCEACERRMDGAECIDDGRAWRWGDEPDHEFPPLLPCRDCGVKVGGFHHEGCCVATCRTCNDQRLGCECGGRAN